MATDRVSTADKEDLPQLKHIFRRSNTEHPEPLDTTLTGKIPCWLEGSLLRNGPGLFDIGEQTVNHVFDGMALLHRFNIKQGKITYQSRYLRSDVYKANTAANRIVFSEFGTLAHPDPCKHFFQNFFSYFIPPTLEDNCNISLAAINDDVYVCTESQYLRKIDPETLETLEKVDYSKYVAVNSATAHPHKLPDGTVYNIGYTFGVTTTYSIIKIDPPKKDEGALQNATIICRIPTKYRLYPSYFHSFGITKNFIVFLEQPLYVNVRKIAMAKLTGTPVSNALEFDPKSPAIFHVIRRDTGKRMAVNYVTDGFFSFHHANTYEDGDHIIVDVSVHDDIRIIEAMTFENIRRNNYPILNMELRRYALPLNITEDTPIESNLISLDYTTSAAVKKQNGDVYIHWETITDKGIELPIIDYDRYNGKKYRYVYGVGKTATTLMKVDYQAKTCKEWKDTEFHYPGEPAFVAAPNSTCEDDGVVLSCILTSKKDMPAYLLILDAKTFEEIARAVIPIPMAFGLHGIFIKAN
ncbi:carotenoid-cleaving dioxygenase, mitochondrial-like [Glandiceps talaboti]